jgi:hypothetical protein
MRLNTRHPGNSTQRMPWQYANFVGAILGYVLDDKFGEAHTVVYEHGRYSAEELHYHHVQSPSAPPLSVNGYLADLTEEEQDVHSTLLIPEAARLLKIVGDAGVGKSTFVRHFAAAHLPTGGLGPPTPIYLDWGGFTAPVADPLTEIYKRFHRKIFSILEEKISPDELTRIDYEIFDTGEVCATARAALRHVSEELRPSRRSEALAELLQSDPVLFSYARINAISGSDRNRFILIFDNVDHLRPEVLARLMDFINEVRRAIVSLVIVAVRDHTDSKGSIYFPEAAGPAWIMRLYPPLILPVLSRRLDYFFPKVFDERKHLHIDGSRFGVRIKDASEAAAICRALLESPLANEETSAFLKKWSNYSIRDLFRVLQTLLQFHGLSTRGSRSLVTKKPFEITLDDVVVALTLDRHTMFYPTKSQVCNVYSSGEDRDPMDRLVGVRLLQFLRPDSYPQKCADVRAKFELWGYSAASFNRQLTAMLKKDVIWSTSGNPEEFDEQESFIRLSYRGDIYADILLERVTYNYAMAFDVPFTSGTSEHVARSYLFADNSAERETFADLSETMDTEALIGRVLGLAELQLEAELAEWERVSSTTDIVGFRQAFGVLTCSMGIVDGLARFLSSTASGKGAARRGGLPSVDLQEAVVAFHERVKSDQKRLAR